MSIRASLEQLIEIGNKRDEVHFGFIKHILLMASGILAVLVSLHKSDAVDHNIRISFAIALSLLSLGILLLSIALYTQVSVQKNQFMKWKAEIVKQLDDENYSPQPVFGEPSKVYSFCEKVGYLSFILSIVFLTLYAILIA